MAPVQHNEGSDGLAIPAGVMQRLAEGGDDMLAALWRTRIERHERETYAGVRMWLSYPFGGDSSVRERDRNAGAAEVDHRDQGVGGVESVGAV